MLTTRSPNIAEGLCGLNHAIQLSTLSPLEARHFLGSHLHLWDARDGLWVERWEGRKLDELVTELGYIPFAINQAICFIQYHGTTITNYLEHFRKTAITLQVNTPSGLTREQNSTGWQESLQLRSPLITTFQVSFDHLRQQHCKTAELLSLMALLDETWVPKTLLEDGLHCRAADFQEAWNMLQAFSFIAVADDGRALRLHRLVGRLVRHMLAADGELSKWKEKALLLVSEGFPTTSYENQVQCAMCMTHADAVLQYSDSGQSKSTLLVQIAEYLQQLGYYQVAEARIREALAIQQAELGMEDVDTVKSTFILGWLLNQQGKHEAAKKAISLARTTCTQILGSEYPMALDLAYHTALVMISSGEVVARLPD